MFKKKEKPKRDHTGKSLSQYGLFDMPADFDTGIDNADDDDDDEDLEAELAALDGGGGGSSIPKKPQRKIIPQKELNSMVSETLKDVEKDDEDDDISVDENDPELLGELDAIKGNSEEESEEVSSPFPESKPSDESSEIINILYGRLKNYEICETKAKGSGENMKAKRYNRAIKTLKDLIKQVNAGHPVDLQNEGVPPDINIPQANVSPATADEVPKDRTPPESISPSNETIVEIPSKETPSYDPATFSALLDRQKQYKIAALKFKQSGDAQKAVMLLKVSKQFDAVIAALKNGQPIDLSNMPGPPDTFLTFNEPKLQENEVQQSKPEAATDDVASGGGLIMASSVMEALEQRLQVYKDQEAKSQEENNSSKARRYGRIIKQFEQAIKAHKAGKPFAFEELPTPPGYGPIPGIQPAHDPSELPTIAPQPSRPARRPAPAAPTNNEGDSSEQTSASNKKEGVAAKSTEADKQMQILIAKQKQFKLAALEAKKRGEMAQAKEFLRQAKGFDKLIDASIAGLPVDWSSIPVSPEAKSQLDYEYNIVMDADNDETAGIDSDLFARLENQLQKQLKMCLTTRDHNKAIGDIPGMNRFERLALNVTKDLDVIRASRKLVRIPKFHYEIKEFSIVKSFTEIGDNDMEVTIHRGINIKPEKNIDTYVKMEFPFPQDSPYSDKTGTFKDTNSPEYQKTFVVPIQRNSRQCQRVFKRHSIKLEVYSKGCSCCDSGGSCECWDTFIGGLCCVGFFRSDALIGTVNIKLQPLETQCEIHESFDLMDGRRKLGGKLEIQIKLRSPIQTQQVEQIQEKWLIIDQ